MRMSLPEHAARNRAAWTKAASDYVENARRNWATAEMSWGIWDVPETEVGVIGDVARLDVVELGCGTAYWSAWLARAGARPTGVDITPAQLDTARAMQAEHGLVFLTNSIHAAMCMPDEGAAGDRLLRAQRDVRRLEWPDDESVEFHLPHGEWIAALAAAGFAVESLHELYAPADAVQTRFEWVTPEWAQRWPYE